MRSAPLPLLLILLALTGCSNQQPRAERVQTAPLVALPDMGFMAEVPLSGPIPALTEPAAAAPLIAESKRRYKGEGGPVDREGSAALLREAAALGSAQAAFTLALFKIRGEGMAQDMAGGMADLGAVARRGHGEAAALLGERLIPRDPERGERQFEQAVYWLNVARRAGHAGAMRGQRNLLAAIEADHPLAADTGLGDSAENAIRFKDPPPTGDMRAREQAVAARLYPGWKLDADAPGRLELINSSGQRAVLFFAPPPGDAAGGTAHASS